VCGRRCRIRRRNCGGPYRLNCKDRGKAYELEDCPALEEAKQDDYEDDFLSEEEDDDSSRADSDEDASFTRRKEKEDFMRSRPQQLRSRPNQIVRKRRLRRRRKP